MLIGEESPMADSLVVRRYPVETPCTGSFIYQEVPLNKEMIVAIESMSTSCLDTNTVELIELARSSKTPFISISFTRSEIGKLKKSSMGMIT